MKKWVAPAIDELKVSETAQGQTISSSFDEIRVDQNGNYWASFSSGADSMPEVDGTITVNA